MLYVVINCANYLYDNEYITEPHIVELVLFPVT